MEKDKQVKDGNWNVSRISIPLVVTQEIEEEVRGGEERRRRKR